MSLEELNLENLPLQHELVKSVYTAFISEDNVVAAVLVGSLAQVRETEYLTLIF